MEKYLLYLLESSICFAMFYTLYWLLLRKETYFRINRFYLLVTLIISNILPLIEFSSQTQMQNTIQISTLDAIVIRAEGIRHTVTTGLSSVEWLTMIYFIGVGLYLIIFLYKLIKLWFSISGSKIILVEGSKIFIINENISPCSFFNYIFIDKNTYDKKESEQIIRHEKVHIREYHSIDLIFIEILTIIFWFNPFIYLYSKSLKDTHEFFADKEVINSGNNSNEYKKLIFEFSYGSELIGMTNNFNSSTILRRMKMLNSAKSGKIATLKVLISVPLIAVFVIAFACTKQEINQPIKPSDFGHILDENGHKQKPDKFPRPKIGWNELEKWIAQNLKYPSSKADSKVTVKINVNFYVDENGKISNVQSANGAIAGESWKSKVGNGFDEEAERVVRAMPDWEPAVYKGKPYKMPAMVGVVFGDKEIWEAKNPPSFVYENLNKSDIKSVSRPPDNNYKMPEFPGGHNKLLEYLRNNIKFPEAAKRNDVSGTVYASFVVDEKGKITDLKIEAGVRDDIDKEALRVLKLMPDWIPASLNGKSSKYKITIPIKFRLQ